MSVDVQWHGAQALAALRRGVESGLEHAAAVGLAASNRLAPTLTGSLERSGETRVSGAEAVVYYTDEAAPYQHERLDFRHDDGQAKFLEQGLAGARGRMANELAEAIREQLR